MESGQDAFDRTLTHALNRWGMDLSAEQLHWLRNHFAAIINANRTMNLTRITEPVEAAVKHYADSLALLLWIDERRIEVESVLDIGTGAGFPAVPWRFPTGPAPTAPRSFPESVAGPAAAAWRMGPVPPPWGGTEKKPVQFAPDPRPSTSRWT